VVTLAAKPSTRWPTKFSQTPGKTQNRGAAGATTICLRVLETDETRAKRAERNKRKGLQSLAERISSYGRTVHERYPTGDVIVSERDLAEQLRKRPDTVATALNLLLNEQKVQRAPLNGYWKLNA
jgi:hypothetical protein